MDATARIVAIQGIAGSFHDEAAADYFVSDYDILPCETFRELFSALNKRKATHAVMAIENTVAGTILPNYALLRDSAMHVVGEIYVAIRQNLLALPGVKLENLREVHSHPMAIQQCERYFERHPHIRLVETHDTAASAAWIRQKRPLTIGAIAGRHAARLYGLHSIASGIETDKRNFTRFLVLTHASSVDGDVADKASVAFHLPHTVGSLAKVLTTLAEHGCNLTKIQSLPMLGREWEYFMHIDLEFNTRAQFQRGISAITPHVHQLKILGLYQRGRKEIA